jgi:hypothetical protein
MLIPSLIAVVILLAPISYVLWRKLSVVEQDITFATPQRGVAGLSVVIKEDTLHRLRIIFDDGQVCDVFPAAAEKTGRASKGQDTRADQLSC